MKASIAKAIKITMHMDESESRWLMSYLQNSCFDDESVSDAEMRKAFFNTIKYLLDGETNNDN